MVKSTETEIAVLQNQMQDVKASLEVIKADQHTNFTTLVGKIDSLANTPLEIAAIHHRLSSLERSNSRTWVWNTLSAIVGGIFMSLAIYALTRR